MEREVGDGWEYLSRVRVGRVRSGSLVIGVVIFSLQKTMVMSVGTEEIRCKRSMVGPMNRRICYYLVGDTLKRRNEM